MQKILIMGLPGAGKTYFAQRLKRYLETHSTSPFDLKKAAYIEFPQREHGTKVTWFNADEIRKKFNDWDFSREGRIRQSIRMAEFALRCSGDYVICDFIAPLPEQRDNFKADWTIWMDTIAAGRYDDTNEAFVPPDIYDFRITEQDAEKWVPYVAERIVQNKR